MALPKSLTKVTLFSKALALVFFIVFPFVGFFAGMQYQRLVDMTAFLESTVPMQLPATTHHTITVKLSDNNKIVYAQPGDRIVVILGDNFNWGLKLSSESILQAAPNGVFYVNMPQGQYKAVTPGTVVISAIGTPKCERGKLCSMLAISFQTTLIIK